MSSPFPSILIEFDDRKFVFDGLMDSLFIMLVYLPFIALFFGIVAALRQEYIKKGLMKKNSFVLEKSMLLIVGYFVLFFLLLPPISRRLVILVHKSWLF